LAKQTPYGASVGVLANIIEEAVLTFIFERTAEQIKSDTGDMSGEDIDSLVDEDLVWARRAR
jgi:hypothetical protein